eukprot:5427317-Amphidinium_carterae.2
MVCTTASIFVNSPVQLVRTDVVAGVLMVVIHPSRWYNTTQGAAISTSRRRHLLFQSCHPDGNTVTGIRVWPSKTWGQMLSCVKLLKQPHERPRERCAVLGTGQDHLPQPGPSTLITPPKPTHETKYGAIKLLGHPMGWVHKLRIWLRP